MYGMLGILGCNVSCDCKGLQMGCIPDDRTHASKVKQRWLLGPMFPRAGKKREPLSAREGDDSSQHPHVASCLGKSRPVGQDMSSVLVTMKAQTDNT